MYIYMYICIYVSDNVFFSSPPFESDESNQAEGRRERRRNSREATPCGHSLRENFQTACYVGHSERGVMVSFLENPNFFELIS